MSAFNNDVNQVRQTASSLYALKMNCFGGLCEITNGNHRFIAAKAWLIAKDGEDAFLKRVNLTYVPISKPIKKLINTSLETRSELMISPVNFFEKYETIEGKHVLFYLRLKGEVNDVYAFFREKNALVRLKVKTYPKWIERFTGPREEPWIKSRYWRTVPFDLLDRALDDSWIQGQLS